MTSTASDAPIAHVEAEQPGLDAGDEPARIAVTSATSSSEPRMTGRST